MTGVKPELSSVLSANDHELYGRCFTATPTLKMIQKGIKQIDLYLKIVNKLGPVVLFHTPGMFSRDTYRQPLFFNTYASRWSELIFEYEVHNNLEIGAEEPCTMDKGYDADHCTHTRIEKDTLEQYGCTTPFGPNKNNICTNQTVGQQVLKYFKNTWALQKSECKVPCRKLITRQAVLRDSLFGKFVDNDRNKPLTKMTLYMKEQVKTTEEIFLYTGLSLVAEIGGYVGLFLGWSVVNQISMLVNLVYSKLAN